MWLCKNKQYPVHNEGYFEHCPSCTYRPDLDVPWSPMGGYTPIDRGYKLEGSV
jgi:hypothetical protein